MNQIRLPIILLVMFAVTGCSSSESTQAKTPFTISTILPMTSTPINTPEEHTSLLMGFQNNGPIESGANISITSSDDVSMRNLRISICLVQIGNTWRNVALGIDSFSIEAKASLFDFSKENTLKTTCGLTTASKEVTFTTDEILPGKEYAAIVIKIDPSVKLTARTYEGKMYIKTPTKLIGGPGGITIESAVFGRFADSAIYLIQKRWSVADFRVRVECDNCISKEETYSLSFRENMNIAGCKILTQDTNYITESCLFSFSFSTPEDFSGFLPEKEDRYFLAVEDVPESDLYGYHSLSEISKEQFYTNTP